MNRINYRTAKGSNLVYNHASFFVKPEIQGLIERTVKSGIVKMRRNYEQFRDCVIVTTDLGFIVMNIKEVASV